MSAYQQDQVDLTNCDREPIHKLGLIQDFGALIAVTDDFNVAHLSANSAEVLGLERPIAIGDRLADYFPEEPMRLVRRKLAEAADLGTVERLFGLDLTGRRRLFDCALHRSGRLLVIEVEPHERDSLSHHGASLRPIAERLERASGVEDLCHHAARHLKRLLGFDRVMVYRFHPDLSGEVVAEARESHLESFLNLRYPRSDIPDQARRLYLQNTFRIIADVNAKPVPILPERGLEGDELDLSMSVLRAVSPIHIEYLQNMGVGASLSISIVTRGRLWGLFACHHYAARRVSYSLRTVTELFAQLFSLRLELAIAEAGSLMTERARALHEQLMTRLAGGGALIDNLSVIADVIGEIIPHHGSSAFVEGRYKARGAAPAEEEFRALVPALNTGSAERIIASEALREIIPQAAAFSDRVVGGLAIPVSRRPRDYVVLWRRELPQVVTWGGDPRKPVETGPHGDRLTPRKSFAAWQESVQGRSAPWTEEEIGIAERLRVTLLEVILRITDEQMQERTRAQERQELLIAELNHRVRNILTLIRGLVSQSRGEAKDVGQFTELIGGRIKALAMAHDNLTQEQWAPASLHDLIHAEAQAYLAGKTERVSISGTDALIAPEGYTVLALVLHEMMTNSAKYGSLCDRSGRLDITTAIDERGNLEIAWRERGGPPVRAPERRGFGSTIIERSIPHELRGEAEIRYRLGGVEADFVIPAKLVTEHRREQGMPDGGNGAVAQQTVRLGEGRSIARALVVEDSMIIAMDTEDNLLRLGVPEVVVASSVETALEEVERGAFDIALLDFNLGDESSERVAERLAALGTPFWFVTGYGDAIDGLASTKANGVLKKPYSLQDLEAVLARFGPA
jgi:light-regulated signal transduction histidine kinase (bacteriophytochrome)